MPRFRGKTHRYPCPRLCPWTRSPLGQVCHPPPPRDVAMAAATTLAALWMKGKEEGKGSPSLNLNLNLNLRQAKAM